MELVSHPLRRDYSYYSPQYIDFTSPAFLALIEAIAASEKDTFCIHEQLPQVDAFPRDGAGRSWCVELLVYRFTKQYPDWVGLEH